MPIPLSASTSDTQPRCTGTPAPITLQGLLQACRSAAFAKLADPCKYERAFCTFFFPILDRPVLELNAETVQGLITAALTAGAEPKTLNLRIYAVRGLIRAGMEAGLLPYDPIKGLRTLRSQIPRNRVLTPDNRLHVWQALYAEELALRGDVTASPVSEIALLDTDCPFASPLTPKLMVTMATGLSPGHSDRLLWSALDLKRKTMSLVTRLGGLQDIPLADPVIALLRRWRTQSRGALVFPARIPELRVTVRGSWNHMTAALTVSGLRWSDLRSDYGNRLVELGAPHDHVRYLMACEALADTQRAVDDAYFGALRATAALRAAECPLDLHRLGMFVSSGSFSAGHEPTA